MAARGRAFHFISWWNHLIPNEMKTIFDKDIRDQLIHRVVQIDADKQALWGKMNVYQMVRHNTYWNGWLLGNDGHTYKQAPIGKIFGKVALRKMVRNENPLDKNIPTSE